MRGRRVVSAFDINSSLYFALQHIKYMTLQPVDRRDCRIGITETQPCLSQIRALCEWCFARRPGSDSGFGRRSEEAADAGSPVACRRQTLT